MISNSFYKFQFVLSHLFASNEGPLSIFLLLLKYSKKEFLPKYFTFLVYESFHYHTHKLPAHYLHIVHYLV